MAFIACDFGHGCNGNAHVFRRAVVALESLAECIRKRLPRRAKNRTMPVMDRLSTCGSIWCSARSSRSGRMAVGRRGRRARPWPPCKERLNGKPPPLTAMRPLATRANGWRKIRARVAICELCPHLAASRTQTVFGVGNADADLMFIGEAPGADEDRAGRTICWARRPIAHEDHRDDGIQARRRLHRECSEMPAGHATGCVRQSPANVRGNAELSPVSREQIAIIQPKVLVALGADGRRGPPRHARHDARSARKMAFVITRRRS